MSIKYVSKNKQRNKQTNKTNKTLSTLYLDEPLVCCLQNKMQSLRVYSWNIKAMNILNQILTP